MDINLELYKIFYYVATTLSFSEASRQLYISQSAVSQSVKALEKKLNHTLFIRSTKKVLLTAEGEMLLQHVKPALQMLNEGENLLSGDTLLKGHLRIAASDTICRYFLIDYLQSFHRNYPDVRIKITNSTSIGCVDLLEKGQADLIVCNYPNSRLNSHFRTKVLKEFQDIFVANTDFFPVTNASDPSAVPATELTDLLKYPILMLSSKSTTSEYLHQVFAAHSLNLLPEVELNSNDLLIDLARIGLGIACVPDYMLKNMDHLTQITLKDPLPRRQLVLAQHENLTASPAAKCFLEMF